MAVKTDLTQGTSDANEGTPLRDVDDRKHSKRDAYTGVRCQTPTVLE